MPWRLRLPLVLMDGAACIRDPFAQRYAPKENHGILQPARAAAGGRMPHRQPRVVPTRKLGLQP